MKRKIIFWSSLALILISAGLLVAQTVTKGYIGKQDFSLWDGTSTKTFTRQTSQGYDLTLNKVDWPGVDVLQVYGAGASRTHTAISSAIIAAGSNLTPLWIAPGTWTLAGDVTFTANTIPVVPPGAVFSVNSGSTLTFTSPTIQADGYQIFTGNGEVDFADGTEARLSWFASLSAAAAYIDANKVKIIVDRSETISSDLTLPSTIELEFANGAVLTVATAKTLTVNGPLSAGLKQIFLCAGTGEVILTNKYVRPEWWGGLGDDSTDCTSAFAKAGASAIANRTVMRTQTLLLSDGVYRVTATSGNFAVAAWYPIKGTGPNNSVIKNVGTGTAMRVDAAYYSRFENFSVVGNASSEDGICLGYDYAVATAYMQFSHVDSTNHGRDGLRVVHAWGTKFLDCKFSSNGGLGVHLYPDDAHPGTKNAHVFRDCEARWNGGVTNNTGVYTKGGVLITNANGVYWLGGIVESNNAWGFIIGTNAAANKLIRVQDCYMESNPPSASEGAVDVPTTVGGSIYAAAKYERVEVTGCYIAYGGIKATQTGYAFYVASSPENYSYFKEWGNYTVSNGGAGSIQRDSGLYVDWTKEYVTNKLAAGTHAIFYNDYSGNISISGFIHVVSEGSANYGVYPFYVGYDTANGELSSVGSAIVGSGATAPTISLADDSWGKIVSVVVAASHTAHVKLTINGKYANSLHAYPFISGAVWNEDFTKRAN